MQQMLMYMANEDQNNNSSIIRSRTEIVAQILQTVYDNDTDDEGDGKGLTHTEIMYMVYLSSGSLREYLVALTVHVLLIYDPAMRRYHITERGIRFLELYCRLGDMMTEEEQKKKEGELEFSHTG
jgi:predicted transcriptional regulator